MNGPVLHILPSLEKVVQFRSEKERALKIVRAQVGSRRIVGVRFPSDNEAIQNLQAELDKNNKARRNAGTTFTDEALAPICRKTMLWATTKRKTMKSFFKLTSTNSGTSNNKNLKALSAADKNTSGNKRKAIIPSSSGKKARTMLSYFPKI